MIEKKEFVVDQELRLDQFLTIKLKQTRNQIEHLIKKGFVEVQNKKKAKSGLKLQLNQKVIVTLPEVLKDDGYDVDFDIDIIYEDEYFMVLNKPAGVIVHGAPSVHEATLVDWLIKRGISLSTISGESRHGIVHRLDKGTSGLIVVAKTNEAHVNLSKQLEKKTMGRYYLALIDTPIKDDITIDKPLARDPNNRLKFSIQPYGKLAITSFAPIDTTADNKYQLIGAKLFTGRTHQIRVHLASFNRHIIGDTLYGFKGKFDKINRVYLHAFCLYLNHPITSKSLEFSVQMPQDMIEFYKKYFKGYRIEEINKQLIISKFNSTI